MKDKEEKITRVIFEYEDHAEELTGKEAEEWLETVNGMCVDLNNRGRNPFDNRKFNWEASKDTMPSGGKSLEDLTETEWEEINEAYTDVCTSDGIEAILYMASLIQYLEKRNYNIPKPE